MNNSTAFGITIMACLCLLWSPACKNKATSTTPSQGNREQFSANYGTPLLDGVGTDEIWQQAEWLPIDQLWIGDAPTPADFTGRYKVAWDENFLYLLAEITDDTLLDQHEDGLEHFWDDDCLEIFIDEDAAGGDHQYNYSAFAYHIALDGKVVDTRPNHKAGYFNDHCTTRRITTGNTSLWEVAIRIFDDSYSEEEENIPKTLAAGKKLGFALAYCDNDHSPERENFMGSVQVDGEDKNRGWIDAGIFGVLELK